ncbi:META domain-containing protein [Sphingomonadaceae bacterium jetA1]|jgi:heat shock protein HslJ/putative hemolysin|uniref:META domain-containing protein n=1 Tax=Facivitalis istanbulensis TaxID=3075838 RepID=UPI00346F2A08
MKAPSISHYPTIGALLLVIGATGCTATAAPEHQRVGLANPASAYCTKQGGTLEIRKGEAGETGYCHFPDGRVVEEWALYRAQGGTGSPVPSGDNSRDALDWAGTYRGVLPCADCDGIETIVTLKADGSYASRSRYLGRDSKPFTEDGTFRWDAAGGTITLSGQEPARYRVGENRLVRLALDGTPITGALADHYVLEKSSEGITEKYWKLVELNGRPVAATEQQPHLILKAEGSHVTGFGGCNSFTGTYTLDEKASRITFEQMASTMRACTKGMDVERAFSEMLSRVDNYSLNGDHLTLNRARMAPLARFEAVSLR